MHRYLPSPQGAAPQVSCRNLCYVNAGHETPFICRRGGVFQPWPVSPGFVLAGLKGMAYQSGSMRLAPGDKLFQYTDGVTEATDQDNRLYGTDRLAEILRRPVSRSSTASKAVINSPSLLDSHSRSFILANTSPRSLPAER